MIIREIPPKSIYLDFCLFVDMREDRDPSVSSVVERLKDKGYIFPFSGGHLEEVAVIYRQQQDPKRAKELVESHLDTLSAISSNYGLRPIDDSLGIYVEEPRASLKRVLDEYEMTRLVEEIRELHVAARKGEALAKHVGISTTASQIQGYDALRSKAGVETKAINNVAPEDLANRDEVKRFRELWIEFGHSLPTKKWPDLRSNWDSCCRCFDECFNFIDALGYWTDDAKKSRSGIHDVTHALYAAGHECFVSGDKRAIRRAKAVYAILGVDTQVLSKQEFVKQYGSTTPN